MKLQRVPLLSLFLMAYLFANVASLWIVGVFDSVQCYEMWGRRSYVPIVD